MESAASFLSILDICMRVWSRADGGYNGNCDGDGDEDEDDDGNGIKST